MKKLVIKDTYTLIQFVALDKENVAHEIERKVDGKVNYKKAYEWLAVNYPTFSYGSVNLIHRKEVTRIPYDILHRVIESCVIGKIQPTWIADGSEQLTETLHFNQPLFVKTVIDDFNILTTHVWDNVEEAAEKSVELDFLKSEEPSYMTLEYIKIPLETHETITAKYTECIDTPVEK